MVDSIATLLKKYTLRPHKGLGQNFLADPFHLAKIVAAAELSPTDLVLEIGPGLGTLTRLLAEAAGHVVAVEVDPALVHLLQQELADLRNLTLLEADILETNGEWRMANSDREAYASYKVVANLPYYLTSAVIRHLLETSPPPTRLVLTVQKEVAQRIVAGPGHMSLLAVSVQFYGRPAIVHQVPAGAFYPVPKVDSAVLCIDTFSEPAVAVTNVKQFFRIVQAGFGQKRKQLKNALAAGLHKPAPEVIHLLAQADIDPTRRAETLSLAEWGRLEHLVSRS